MTTLREQIDTSLPPGEAFAFIADFSNAAQWDPGVASSERIETGSGAGPVGMGSRFRLGVRMGGRVTPMEYTISTWDPPHRVVLAGAGSGVEAVDDIRFQPTPSGTRIDYVADIRLTGLLRLVSPFAGAAFATIARNARQGMERALDQRAAAR
ncbi:MAG TPA: SRPBCC family protein [Candidatus Limnocylindrales bacterium]|nr:SRPBCC family protein [Candidatus Limnocylindrales bacterium]